MAGDDEEQGGEQVTTGGGHSARGGKAGHGLTGGVEEGGQQTFVDAEKLYGQVQAIGESLQARTGISFPRSRWPIV